MARKSQLFCPVRDAMAAHHRLLSIAMPVTIPGKLIRARFQLSSVHGAISSLEYLPDRMPAGPGCHFFPPRPGRRATRVNGSSPAPTAARVSINMIFLLRRLSSIYGGVTLRLYTQVAD